MTGTGGKTLDSVWFQSFIKMQGQWGNVVEGRNTEGEWAKQKQLSQPSDQRYPATLGKEIDRPIGKRAVDQSSFVCFNNV